MSFHVLGNKLGGIHLDIQSDDSIVLHVDEVFVFGRLSGRGMSQEDIQCPLHGFLYRWEQQLGNSDLQILFGFTLSPAMRLSFVSPDAMLKKSFTAPSISEAG